jgi:hypothetical protein
MAISATVYGTTSRLICQKRDRSDRKRKSQPNAVAKSRSTDCLSKMHCVPPLRLGDLRRYNRRSRNGNGRTGRNRPNRDCALAGKLRVSHIRRHLIIQRGRYCPNPVFQHFGLLSRLRPIRLIRRPQSAVSDFQARLCQVYNSVHRIYRKHSHRPCLSLGGIT